MGRTKSESGRTRRHWSEEEKRAIVTEALEPGASIAAVARRHALNTNLLHGWRRLYGSPIQRPVEPVLLPMDITRAAQAEQSIEGAPRRASKPCGRQGIIEIELPCGARLRCDQHVEREALALVVDVLMARS
jgi:transposase